MANKYLDLNGLKAYNGALLGTQIGSLVTYDSTNSKFVKTTFTYNSETGIVTKATADVIATNGVVASGNTNLVTGNAVYQAIQGITEPMIFKGATSALPTGTTLSPIKVGYTYKLTADIENIPTESGKTENAKLGDTIICSTADSTAGTATYWAIIPSGDEPKGTVTDITIGGDGASAITKGAQTTAGVIPLTVNVAEATGANAKFGVVQTGDNITNSNGVIGVNTATSAQKGVVQIGTNLSVADGVVSVATATDAVKGVVQIGDNIDVASGVISVKTGSTTDKGVLQVGTNLSVSDGVVSVATANGTNLGLAKQGTNVTVGSDGAINVATGASNTLGLVQADGTSIVTDGDGLLTVSTITYGTTGSDIDNLFAQS